MAVVRRLEVLAIVVGSLLVVPGSAVAANLTSTFDTGSEGWQEVGNHPTDLTSPASHRGAGGNPGGYLEFNDAVADPPQGGGIISPSAWGGNRTANYGGRLTFDLRPTATATDRPPFAVIREADGDTLEKTFPAAPAPNVWTRLTATLDPSGGWNYRPIATGVASPATAANFQDVLGEVQDVSLLGDLKTGTDTTGFDNVGLLEPGAGLPVPGGKNIKRKVSISYSANRFRGRVKPAGGCATQELVRVFRVKKGKDPMVGKDKTNGNGRYVAPEANADGRYYARVKKSLNGADTCLAARSKNLNVGA